MKNIFFANEELILSMNDHEIDGLGGKVAPLDVLYDCLLVNVRNFDKPGEPWHECTRSRDDVAFWEDLRDKVTAAKDAGELKDMKEAFFLSFRR